MTSAELDAAVVRSIGEGWVELGRGRVIAPDAPGVCFSERVEGLGTVRSGDRLLDDGERFVHLRDPDA